MVSEEEMKDKNKIEKDREADLYSKYPIAWEKYNDEIDRLFPKGDKRRGDALVLGSMVFIYMDKELTDYISKAIDESNGKFLVFINYGSDGWGIQGEYESLESAVKGAIENSYGSEFKVVKEVNWKPVDLSQLSGDKK